MDKFKVIIIGGGVSGMIAAIRAKSNNVAIVEATPRLGKKLLSTGNGKCNLLNKNLNGKYYNDPDFVAPTFGQYGEAELEKFYNDLGLELRFDEVGRGYPMSESAATVLEVLRRAIDKKGTTVFIDTAVIELRRTNGGFALKTTEGELFAEKVVCAVGSDASFGLDSLGLLKGLADAKPFMPSLTPLCTATDKIKGLNGVRVKCVASLISGGKTVLCEDGEVLFKSFGLSGIAVFNLSAEYARRGNPKDAEISLNFLQQDYAEAHDRFMKRANMGFSSAEELLTGMFQKMLILAILNYAGVSPNAKPNTAVCEKLLRAATEFKVRVTKQCDKSMAQVMHGGVCVEGINKNTLESKSVKNLYFIGEAADIDGYSGGYNLMWAAASAMVAADSLV